MPSLAADERRALDALCRLHGVQRSYRSALTGRPVRSPDESVLAVLAALGAPLSGAGELRAALRARRLQLARRTLAPVTVAWDGAATSLSVRLPAAAAGQAARAQATLHLEDGTQRALTARLVSPRGGGLLRVESERFVERRLRLPAGLPQGYHRLELELCGLRHEAHVLCAPTRPRPAGRGAGGARRGGAPRADAPLWGGFLPLYALHSRRSWGAGDLTDLAALRDWLGEQGAGLVATLPLLAAFLELPCEPSPYVPASRRFWNEFYLDATSLPEFARSPAAHALAASPEVQRELEALRGGSLVDWKRAPAVRRRVLQTLADEFFADGARGLDDAAAAERAAFDAHRSAHPLLEGYARFRATAEQRRQPWMHWPAPQREGALASGDWDEAGRRYHLYTQWRSDQALRRLSESPGPGLYLDLPLGTHPDGFDTWEQRSAFAAGVSGGAPPDALFTGGQDWGFPPPHPEGVREQGHRYFAQCVRHHLSVARVLRIDHVLGLHRLYCIPHGAPSSDGVYVEQPAEELYAVLSIESARSGALVVGEDLGTVPGGVRPALLRHGLLRTHVAQCELAPGAGARLPAARRESQATLNTHDMPPFLAWLRGLDVADRVELGLLDPALAPDERARRERTVDALAAALRRGRWLKVAEPSPAELFEAALAWLGRCPARLVIVNLEDLWGETRSQNTPGTTTERDNWKRRSRMSLEEFADDPRVRRVLAAIAGVRRRRVGR